MTDYVEPLIDQTVDADRLRTVAQNAAHAPSDSGTPGWISPDGVALTANGSALNGFFPDGSSSDLSINVNTGEAVIHGTYVARDTSTAVTLPSNSSVTVVLSFDPASAGSLFVGLASNAPGPSIPLADYDTDGASVTDQTDRRLLGPVIDVPNQRYEGEGGTVASADTAANLDGRGPTFYYRDTGLAELPITTVSANDDVQTMEVVPDGKTMKITRVVFMDDSGSVPTNTRLSVQNADEGDTVYRNFTNRLSTAALSAPLVTMEGPATPRFRIENNSGANHLLMARAIYSLDQT